MEAPQYVYNAVIKNIHDGDTITVDFDLGLNVWLMNEKIRLYGINAPEIFGTEKPQGEASLQALETQIAVGDQVVIQTYKDKTGKYGRWLGTVWKASENVNQWMLDNGWAVVDNG